MPWDMGGTKAAPIWDTCLGHGAVAWAQLAPRSSRLIFSGDGPAGHLSSENLGTGRCDCPGSGTQTSLAIVYHPVAEVDRVPLSRLRPLAGEEPDSTFATACYARLPSSGEATGFEKHTDGAARSMV